MIIMEKITSTTTAALTGISFFNDMIIIINHTQKNKTDEIKLHKHSFWLF